MLPSHEVQRQASKPNAMKTLLDAYEDEGKDLEKEMGALLCGAVHLLVCEHTNVTGDVQRSENHLWKLALSYHVGPGTKFRPLGSVASTSTH